MTDNEHFNTLVENINNGRNNNDIKLKLDNMTNNNLTFDDTKTECSIVSNSSESLFNHLHKLDKDKLTNLNLKNNQILFSIFYTINYNEYNLITDKSQFIDTICNKLLINLNDLYKHYKYKTKISKKNLRKLIEESDVTNYYFLMILADYLDINLIIASSRLLKFINTVTKRATIIIYKDKDQIYNYDKLFEYDTIAEIKLNYSKQYANYESLDIRSITNYKLDDLKLICSEYDIAINPNQKLKKDIYNLLSIFFKL